MGYERWSNLFVGITDNNPVLPVRISMAGAGGWYDFKI